MSIPLANNHGFHESNPNLYILSTDLSVKENIFCSENNMLYKTCIVREVPGHWIHCNCEQNYWTNHLKRH